MVAARREWLAECVALAVAVAVVVALSLQRASGKFDDGSEARMLTTMELNRITDRCMTECEDFLRENERFPPEECCRRFTEVLHGEDRNCLCFMLHWASPLPVNHNRYWDVPLPYGRQRFFVIDAMCSGGAAGSLQSLCDNAAGLDPQQNPFTSLSLRDEINQVNFLHPKEEL